MERAADAHDLDAMIEKVAGESGFAGVVRVDGVGPDTIVHAFGFADRGLAVPVAPTTRFNLASGTKGFTALTVVRLVVDGELSLDTTARSVLGTDLPLVDDSVTVEHLLAHRSGIGDYFNESAGGAITDYVMGVPVHELDGTEAYLRVLAGHTQVFRPGERFAYNNSGFVLLALIAERVSGIRFEDLVSRSVCVPAGLGATGFVRSDEPTGDIAHGYLDSDGLRTNVLHLPVIGSGDGGIVSSAEDVHRLWVSLFAGRIVPLEWVQRMVEPRSVHPTGSARYGLGFWLAPNGPAVQLEGYDAGASFRSMHDPARGLTMTVISNTSEAAWPMCIPLEVALGLRDS